MYVINCLPFDYTLLHDSSFPTIHLCMFACVCVCVCVCARACIYRLCFTCVVQVLVNLYAAHMCSNVWKDPETFRPERFLDKDGRVINKDSVIAFSLG